MADPLLVAAAARELFPPEVAVAVLDPRQPQAELFPEEASAIRSAVESRRREFASGRAAARQAMTALGLAERPVPMAADRAPVWPPDVVGSISHTQSCCAVAVARGRHLRSVGLDLEDDTSLDPDLSDEICTPAEIAWLAQQAEAERGRLAKLIFSAKECVYKFQYPLTHRLLGFHDVSVAFDLKGSAFTVAFRDALPPLDGIRLEGRYRRVSGLLMTGISLAAASARSQFGLPTAAGDGDDAPLHCLA
jgi:4'-phosphopantetheinyl transferase EntD